MTRLRDPYTGNKAPEISTNGKKRPAKEIEILGTRTGPSRFDFQSNNMARKGKVAASSPTTTTTTNLFFRDPESKPPDRNQGSEPPSHVRSAPLASQSFSASTYPTPAQYFLDLAFHVL